MNDDFLYKFRKPPRREFAAALYQRIATGDSAPMKTNARTRTLRALALSFSVLTVITAVMFFSPSTRALAQSIIHQLGGYIFVQGTPQPPTEVEIAAKKATAAAENGVKVSPEQEATLRAEKMQMADQPSETPVTGQKEAWQPSGLAPDVAAASELAGFTVLAPAYVPAGYLPAVEKDVSGGWEVGSTTAGESARLRFESQYDKSFILIEEIKYGQEQPTTIERPEIVDVTVRGQSGVWMPDDGGKSTLAWEESGITFLVVGNTLSLDEAQKIAESLGK